MAQKMGTAILDQRLNVMMSNTCKYLHFENIYTSFIRCKNDGTIAPSSANSIYI